MDNQKAIEKLREQGILDEAAYQKALSNLKAAPESNNKMAKNTEVQGSTVGVIGDYVRIYGNIFINHNGVDGKELLQRYLNNLAAETDVLPWGRISPKDAGPDKGESSSLRLSDVFTGLDTTELERAAECEEDMRQCLARQAEQKRIPAQTMLADHDRLVLLGDPGSGKTTLMNYLAHVLAKAGEGGQAEQWLARLTDIGGWDHGVLLPVRIVLREFGAHLESKRKDEPAGKVDLESLLRQTLSDNQLSELWPTIHKGLLAGDKPLLVLLDGLDEVPVKRRGQVVELINDLGP